MLAQMYECPQCGDVWRGVELVEIIDTDRDDVWIEVMCCCGAFVRPKAVDDIPVFHELTEEEMLEEQLYADDDYCEHEEE